MGKKLFRAIKYIFEGILDIVYPLEENCVICKRDGFIGLCPSCKAKIKRAEVGEDNISYGFYGGILKELILKFKYGSNFTCGSILSQFLLEVINENNIEADFICYVPMTKASKRKRGFNQCEIIANKISCETNIPVYHCIKKIKDTKEQKSLNKEQRSENLNGAFSIDESKNISGKNILLIDDVITTGATINECKKILKKYNVNKIIVLTLAKSNI